jgi:PHD/YefM family antitoxin component YafN of YafNO toxin-antitoxin module
MAWQDELPALAELSDQEAADAINAMTAEATPVDVFGSFRTFAALLTAAEYETLRETLNTQAASSHLLADAVDLLATPGDANGNGGGLALGHPSVVAMLEQFAAVEGLADVPAKVAAYVASLQPAASRKYQTVDASMVGVARGTRPAVQQEVSNG